MIAWLFAGCQHSQCPVPAEAMPPLLADGPGLRVVQPTTLRDLHAVVSPPQTPVRWRVDGVDSGITGLVVPARRLRPGAVWQAVATIEGAEQSATARVPEPPGGNVLVLLLDDIGVDQVRSYGLNDAAPPTPTLDALAAGGMRFNRAYASPVCSPTRAILLTGRHARRTGVGWIVDTGDADYALPLAAMTVPEALDHAVSGPWATSAVGKWHLAPAHWPGYLDHPLDQGFDWYAGAIGNPSYNPGRGYWHWTKAVNGVRVASATYMTTDTVNDALARVAAMPEPWFLYVAFNAAHTPLSAPPPELTGLLVDDDSPAFALYDATVEALDAEIGRLLDGINPAVRQRTTIVTLGDNGTSPEGVDPPFNPDRAKRTPYEAGIRVPFLVTGPHVAEAGSVSNALVHVADVMPTIAEIAGVPLGGPDDALVLDLPQPVPLDGRSLLPLLQDPDAAGHAHIYTEGFFPNGPGPDWSIDLRTLRDDRYKLVRRLGGPDELYDVTDPLALPEGPNLLHHANGELRAVARELGAALDCLQGSLTTVGF